MSDAGWETQEARRIIINDENLYRAGRRESNFGLERFQTWAEDVLNGTATWDRGDTAKVDYEQLMGDVRA